MHSTVTVDRAGRWLAVVTFLVLALGGCAGPATRAEPYVGTFTGEFVDGKPLYRFPAIYVVGSRGSVGP